MENAPENFEHHSSVGEDQNEHGSNNLHLTLTQFNMKLYGVQSHTQTHSHTT